ncbi:hypothetical protein N9928_01620, partial [bacterium]|nr:hypothetical protein [bacterium]
TGSIIEKYPKKFLQGLKFSVKTAESSVRNSDREVGDAGRPTTGYSLAVNGNSVATRKRVGIFGLLSLSYSASAEINYRVRGEGIVRFPLG